MDFALVEEIPDDPGLAASWNDLVMRTGHPEVCFTYEWAAAVAEAFAETVQPFLILAHEGGQLAGVAVLGRRRDETRRLSFLGGTTADYCDFVSHPQDRYRFVEGVLGEISRQGGNEMTLTNIPARSATWEALGHFAAKHWRSVRHPDGVCPQVRFDSGPDRDRLRDSLRTKRRRYQLRTLERLGPVEVDHVESWNVVAEELEDFLPSHVARFLVNGRTSPLVLEERRHFLHSLCRRLSRRGWLRLSRLRVAGKTIAWGIGFVFAGKWLWYMPTHDVEQEQRSPGDVLVRSVLERALDTPDLSVLDLGHGDEPYKMRLANSEDRIRQVTLTTSRGRYVELSLRRRLVDGLGRWPAADRAARGLVGLATRAATVRVARPDDSSSGFRGGAGASGNGRGGDAARGSFTEESRHWSVKALDWKILGRAALACGADSRDRKRLFRAAERLHDGARGVALVGADGGPLCLGWLSRPGEMVLHDPWVAPDLSRRGSRDLTGRIVAELAARCAALEDRDGGQRS